MFSSNFRLRFPALAHGLRLAQNQHTVNGKVTLNLFRAARPAYGDLLHTLRRSKAEVQPQIVLRKIAATTPHLVDLRASSGGELHAGANGAAIRARSDQPENN